MIGLGFLIMNDGQCLSKIMLKSYQYRQEEGRWRQGEVRGSIFLSDTGFDILNIAFEIF